MVSCRFSEYRDQWWRLNEFLESNREGVWRNNWLGFGYIHGDINTSDGLAKSLSSVNLIILLSGNAFRIVSEEGGKEIRRKPIRGNILRSRKLFRAKGFGR